MLEKRNPLSINARRAGWMGCNFLIQRLPDEGKISIIKDEKIINKDSVNAIWKKMFFLYSEKAEFRGWTSDILKIVEELSTNFSLSEVYRYERYLREIHPSNSNVKAKIRQQLQVLRDNKIIKFLSNGKYMKI